MRGRLLVPLRAQRLLEPLLVITILLSKYSSAFQLPRPLRCGENLVVSQRLTSVLLPLRGSKSSERISVQDFLTDDLSEEIAREVTSSKVRIPLVPSPIVKYVLKQATRNLSSNLSLPTMDRLQQVLRAAKTKTRFDDVMDEKELNDLADQIAVEIKPKIDIPMFDEDQELVVLQQIMRMFLLIVSSGKQDRQKFLLDTTLDLLGSPQDQDRLVKAINAQIEIPLVGEKQQENMIRKAVEASADVVTDVFPPDLGEVLRRESPDGIDKVKQYVTTAANEKVNLVGLGEEQQGQLVEKMVDVLIDQYVDGTEAEYILIGNDIDKQEAFLLGKKARLMREQYLSRLRYEREKINLALHLEKVEGRLKSVRRSRSLMRRFARVFRRRKK